MQLTLPEAIEMKLSPREAALHLAIGMFVSEAATLGQAAEIAGLTQADFFAGAWPPPHPDSLRHGRTG